VVGGGGVTAVLDADGMDCYKPISKPSFMNG
jgi:hypothetical protein